MIGMSVNADLIFLSCELNKKLLYSPRAVEIIQEKEVFP